MSEALLEALGADFTIACPALPENGRSVYLGHLFVGEQLLSDSHMRHHPLTPMTDSNLVRVLQRQSKAPVGLVPYPVVERGPDAIRARFEALRGAGVTAGDRRCRRASVICWRSARRRRSASDHRRLGHRHGPAGELPAQGIARARRPRRHAAAHRRARGASSPAAARRRRSARSSATAPPGGRRSCSTRSALADGGDDVERALALAERQLGEGPVLIASSAPPEEVAKVQDGSAASVPARRSRPRWRRSPRPGGRSGVRRLVVAGGETAGAVVGALGIEGLRIGPPIDPGVPWTTSLGEPPLALALKSGNFGAPDFFIKAFACAP